MKLGSKLPQICKERGLSLSRLAKEAGVPMQTIHAWTTGRKSINPDQLRKVALVLKVSIYELMFDESDPFESAGEEILKEIFSGDLRVTLHRIEKTKAKKNF
jgi:transcriptional regulator with XRE-family HTH domain